MMSLPRLVPAALALLLLAACGDNGEAAKQGPVRNNQILEGSVSDEMISYDTLTSEAPPAKIVPEDGDTPGRKDGAPANGSAAPSAPNTAPASAPAPEEKASSAADN